MTRLAALHARITGDSSGLVEAAKRAEIAVQGAAGAVGGGGIGAGAAGGGLAGAAGRAQTSLSSLARSPGMRMLPIQLSQVVQQAAAGTPVLRALTIQAADIGYAFGAVGTVVGILATLALPPLIAAFSGSREEASLLETALEDLKEISEGLKNAQDILGLSVDELREKYGQFAEGVLIAAQNLANLQAAQARSRLNEQVELLSASMREYMTTAASMGQAGVRQSVALTKLRDDFGLTRDEANAVEQALRDVRDALNFEDRMAALQNLNELLQQAGVDIAEMPPELRQALIETQNLAIAMADLAVEADNAAAAAARISVGTPLSAGMFGGIEGLLPPLPEAEEGEEGGGRRGGGGARQDPLERLQRELETAQEALRDEIEAERILHEERNDMLRQALENELLSHEEYNDLIERERERHHEAMSNLDVYRYGTGAEQLGQFMGDMATAFASGNEEMLRIAKVFGAGEALVNAWRTFSQVMADNTLPWYAKLPAAVSLLGSAMQAVTAIQGAGKGGSGQRTAGGGAASGAGPQAEAQAASPTLSRSLTIIGDRFNRAQAIQIAEFMNEGTDDGLVIRGRT